MRPTWAEIDLDAVKHNFMLTKELVGEGVSVLSVVKADAYGHGAVEVSKMLVESGTDMLGVASLEEALELRDYGIEVPILILGGISPDEAPLVVEHDLIPFLFSLDVAQSLDTESAKAQKKTLYHLKFDTGMTRLGVIQEDSEQFLNELSGFENIIMEGVLTHLSSAFTDSDENTYNQIRVLDELIELVKVKGFRPSYIHAANSAAIQKYPESRYNLVRPGIVLYGSGNYSGMDLKPVMKLKSRIIRLSQVPEGTPVSYGGKFVTKRPSVIATIPVGYADGYTRRLSSRGMVSIKGALAPLAGDVCMDFIMADVTDIQNIKINDEVVLFGDELVSVIDLAQIAGTISYELLSNIGKRVPRIYV
ncbi:MAG: alanine racemase [Thermodesulfobacteriales bacterium]|jgi:alanine racemase|nr:MAG: alanine racemase [Thermodesulfobacteriales bacterium]